VQFSRRALLPLAAGAVLMSAPRVARPETYPSRPVHVIVALPAGSGTDVLARIMAQWLSERLGQSVIVDNRPGAGANIGTEVVAKAAPDGYTLLFTLLANAINQTLYTGLPFDFVRDIVPIASVCTTNFAMSVNPSLPVKTVPELIAYAKANPNKITMASFGNGTLPHVFGELFMMMSGVSMLHVPYRGNFMPDLLSGQVQMAFTSLPSSIAFIKAGKLRALAVTTGKRSDLLPDIPAIGEFVPGYDASAWNGFGAPKGTPAEITDKLNAVITAGVNDPQIKARLAGVGAEPMPMTPAQARKFTAEEVAKWAKVIKFAHITAQ
jgi:tripartite-type tricarboxylate transporter receptor subunit TctC